MVQHYQPVNRYTSVIYCTYTQTRLYTSHYFQAHNIYTFATKRLTGAILRN